MNKRGSILLLVIFFVLGIVFAFGLYFFVFRKNPIVVTKVSETQNTTPTETETPTGIYTHPTLGYSFETPLNWNLTEVETPAGITQDYQNVSLKSPDYVYTEPEDGYATVTSGAEIYISTEKTEATDVEVEFAADTLASSIARNKIVTNIDGVKALQYDFSYEGVTASITTFIKNGVSYFIKLSYPTLSDKTNYWETYASFLYSFTTK
jgi:hypothetical protein